MAKKTPTPQTVLKEIRRLEEHLDGLGMIPATRLYRNAVLLGLLSKSLTVARATCLLVKSGFPAEAFGMSRTLIEIYFCVRYISNCDSESRAETYVKYHARVRKEWQAIILRFYPQTPASQIELKDDVLEAAADFKSKAHWTGSGGQARMMALEPDRTEKDEHGDPEKSEFDYDAIYFWTSHYVHATVVGIEGHASKPGAVFKVRATSYRDEPRGQDALFNTLVFVAKTFVRACRAMNEEQPDALQNILRMLGRVAQRA